ncbi:Putative CheB, chemotaxis response regulator containing a CheY-like receiver domain and a methylesterase domain [Photobacterium profundum SS9]|uniref:Protein-glutamate methylesterase/protein-glutamine glutaminase 1 n=2 Tax=Photobacterium profundum TaxID=74109 RepID=CHEB1_PHOPR|nr:RecName: Full=Protein-glutamate methylesterase/protein-glutamine glutaminase 1 [Photobacterium profundum SS9]CAG19191.1 Putative CheB, chemotaxis response regulator containing a CheY-like receiver domain and a methylesterase domain [Photobacterium profundum SS9]
MVVDDSAVVRQVVSSVLKSDSEIEVCGAVADPLFAMTRMRMQWPDVIVLDIEMPRMDGISFLKKIMAERPTPVVICSTLTEKGADTTMQAISAGAVEIITKPKVGLKGFLHDSAKVLINAVKAASRANLKPLQRAMASNLKVTPKLSADAVLAEGNTSRLKTTEQLVAIGTSTGGTQALELVLKALPRVSPGIVIVQHMPEKFTAAFAERLDSLCEISVKEAKHKMRVLPGQALIAPGGKHMLLKRSGAQYYVEVIDGPLVSRHRPSVDVLFRSVAQSASGNALGIIMTGMGDDGVKGMLEMRRAGAVTLAQDEASCVVYGMPKEAVKCGAVERSLSLSEIPQAILDCSH